MPFVVSADGSALTLTIPDAIRQSPISDLVPRIDVSLTSGPETHDALLIFVPLVFSPRDVLPGSPTLNAVTAGNASATAVWTVPTTGGQNITGYRVRVFSGETVAQTKTVGGSIRTTTVTGLTNRVPCTVDVAALNASGVGVPSARSAITIPRLEFVLPTVMSRTPARDARSVTLATNITATLSEPVTGITASTFTLRTPTGSLVPAQVSYTASSRLATLNPGAVLQPDRRYTAQLSGIRDLAGNLLATHSWTFVTGPAPTITAFSSAANATNVSRTRSVTATLSEPVIGVSTETVKLVITATGVRISTTVTYNAATRVATIDPTMPLSANTRYKATITGGLLGVRDLAGNPLTTRSTFFTT